MMYTCGVSVFHQQRNRVAGCAWEICVPFSHLFPHPFPLHLSPTHFHTYSPQPFPHSYPHYPPRRAYKMYYETYRTVEWSRISMSLPHVSAPCLCPMSLPHVSFVTQFSNIPIWCGNGSSESSVNFLTILDHFCHFFKRLKKASLGLEKRF